MEERLTVLPSLGFSTKQGGLWPDCSTSGRRGRQGGRGARKTTALPHVSPEKQQLLLWCQMSKIRLEDQDFNLTGESFLMKPI